MFYWSLSSQTTQRIDQITQLLAGSLLDPVSITVHPNVHVVTTNSFGSRNKFKS